MYPLSFFLLLSRDLIVFFLSFCAIYTKIVEENSKHPKDIVNFKSGDIVILVRNKTFKGGHKV